MRTDSYGSTEPLQPKRLSQSSFGRKITVAFLLVFVVTIGYFTFNPIGSSLGVARNYNVEEEDDDDRITIQYSYDEMMAYADDMTPNSPNLLAFHAELIESEGIAQIDRSRVQFKVIDPSEARDAAYASAHTIYLNHDDIVYMNSINDDPSAIRDYKDTLIENAGYDSSDLSLSFLFKIDSDNAEDQGFVANCGGRRGGGRRKTKGPKPTKAPRTRRPKPTRAPKPTKSPIDVPESGLNCYTVIGGSAKTAKGFSREEAMCPTGIRTGCSALYTGALADYKGNWGVTAVYDTWKPDNDQGCTAGYYGEDKEGDFQVEARCCQDVNGLLGVAIKRGQTKTNVTTKFPEDDAMCIGMLNSELLKNDLMYTGCAVSGDITMNSNGGTWSGSLDPGFGGVRRRPDGTCKGQSFSDAKYETCTGKDVNSGKLCTDSTAAVIYLDEEDVVYMNSIMHDREKIHEYKETLIENAGYSVDDEVKFEVEGEDTADWLKADCGRGYWKSWRFNDGWNLQAIQTPKCVGGDCWDCTIVDADWSIYNNNLGLYESVVGCAKSAGGMNYDHGSLVDCNGYLDDQIDECEDKRSMKKNYGTYYDGDLCKARSGSQHIRAQAVCCTFG